MTGHIRLLGLKALSRSPAELIPRRNGIKPHNLSMSYLPGAVAPLEGGGAMVDATN